MNNKIIIFLIVIAGIGVTIFVLSQKNMQTKLDKLQTDLNENKNDNKRKDEDKKYTDIIEKLIDDQRKIKSGYKNNEKWKVIRDENGNLVNIEIIRDAKVD